MRTLILLAAASLSALSADAAAQTVIDFEELQAPDSVTVIADVSTKGFRLSSGGNYVFTQSTFAGSANGTTTLGPYGGFLAMTKDGGGAFDLFSIDVGDLLNNQSGSLADLEPFRFTVFASSAAGGSTTTPFVIDVLPGLQTLTLNLTGLNYVSFGGANLANTAVRGFQIDNIRLAAPVVAGAVPEPATWATMIAGFGLVGAAMRRRRTAVRFA